MDTIVSRTLSVHQEHEVLLKLEAAGLDEALAQKVVDSKGNDLATKVVRLIRNGGFEPSTSQTRAHEIMGSNMFGVEEAIKHFGVNPSKQQLAYLADVPFTEAVLEACKTTHVLVAVFPMSLLDIRGACKGTAGLFYDQDWYNKQAFAKERGEVGWYLVRKTPIDDSLSKTWDEQQALLTQDEEPPTIRVLVYTMIGHFKATEKRLFEMLYVRCPDVDMNDNRVVVGHLDAKGLRIRCLVWDYHRESIMGLASARKTD